MTKIKKIVAAVVAAASIGAMGVTASATEDVKPLPDGWMAVYRQGAATSVNRTYYVTVEGRTRGYKVDCTYFNGGNGSIVTVTTPKSNTIKFTETGTYEKTIYASGSPVTFAFSALESTANTSAGGRVLYNM